MPKPPLVRFVKDPLLSKPVYIHTIYDCLGQPLHVDDVITFINPYAKDKVLCGFITNLAITSTHRIHIGLAVYTDRYWMIPLEVTDPILPFIIKTPQSQP
jgi:hypothetical protein